MEQTGARFREQVKAEVNKVNGSWIELGKMLEKVWKDRLYLDYGYNSFEAYLTGDTKLTGSAAKNLIKNIMFASNEFPKIFIRATNELATLPTAEHVSLIRKLKPCVDVSISNEQYVKIEELAIDEIKPIKAIKQVIKQAKIEFTKQTPEEIARDKKISAWNKKLASMTDLILMFKNTKDHRKEKEIEDVEFLIDDLIAEIKQELDILTRIK